MEMGAWWANECMCAAVVECIRFISLPQSHVYLFGCFVSSEKVAAEEHVIQICLNHEARLGEDRSLNGSTDFSPEENYSLHMRNMIFAVAYVEW